MGSNSRSQTFMLLKEVVSSLEIQSRLAFKKSFFLVNKLQNAFCWVELSKTASRSSHCLLTFPCTYMFLGISKYHQIVRSPNII